MATTSTFRPVSDIGRVALIVNFGGGVDSTAILVGLAHLFNTGDTTARPDLILFADTGDELPETYENVRRMSVYCKAVFGIGVTTCSRPLNIPGRVGYQSLSENCVTNETLPGEAFGRGNCSMKWKHEPMDAFLRGRKRPARQGWLEANDFGTKPMRLIGYDATEAGNPKSKRGKNAQILEDDLNLYSYPLVEWGWTRQDCIEAIAAAGLPVPIKSACFMCPNQSEGELLKMSGGQPARFMRALAIEEIARRGKNGFKTIEGLWRRTRKSDGRPGSWVAWALKHSLTTAYELEAEIRELAPHLAES